MAMNTGLKDAIDALWKNPVKKNWEAFSALLKKSNVFYYDVIYESNVDKIDDLKKAYVELYTESKKEVGKVPVYIQEGKKIEGATIYLKGLHNINRPR